MFKPGTLLMYFEIASLGEQMVSKEGLKNWHGSQFVFLGDPILAPQFH